MPGAPSFEQMLELSRELRRSPTAEWDEDETGADASKRGLAGVHRTRKELHANPHKVTKA